MTGHGQQRPCAPSPLGQAHPQLILGTLPLHTFFRGDFSVTALRASLLLSPFLFPTPLLVSIPFPYSCFSLLFPPFSLCLEIVH